MTPKQRLIDAVESIYGELESGPAHAWLERVIGHVDRCVGAGRGTVAYGYDLRGPPSRWAISRPIGHDSPAEIADAVVRSFAATPPESLMSWYGPAGPAGTFSEVSGITLDQLPGGKETSDAHRIRDQIFINGANPDCEGVIFLSNATVATRLGAAERHRFSMLGAHVAAAQRIVRAVARGEAEPAAIFEADGRVAHVERRHEAALPALRRRLLRIDRARGKMRRTDPDAALASWNALLAGEYSTIDRFESDRRRYVVAVVNAPKVLDPRGLTRREAIVASWAARGHADKVIAYELGVAAGTVSALLARVYRKIRVRTRAELVARLGVPSDLTRVEIGDGADVLLFSAPPARRDALAPLTDTEREVATAAARGRTTSAIARARKVSEATVKKQLESIYSKLGVRSRAALARLVNG